MNNLFTSACFALVLGSGMLFFEKAVAQEIYKSVDENGNTVYSDTPISDGSEEVELQDLNIEPGVVPRVRISPEEPQGPEPINVWIAAPENEFVVHQGALSFSVQGETNRNLEKGETAQLVVNGQAEGDPRKTLSWTVGNLIRGEYKIQLQIFRENQIVSSSSVSTVYVRRNFVR